MKYTGIESIDERIEKKIVAAKERRYFIPRELDECNELIPELEEVVKDYKDALKPWYTTSWRAARGAVFSAAWYAAEDAARSVAWEAAEDAARSAAWEAAWYAAEDAARSAAWEAVLYVAWNAALYAARSAAIDVALDAAWEVIRDIEGYENNPFEKIVEIYGMGLYPKGFRKVDGIEKFIVDFPLKKYRLGCWAEGDEEILYWHMWDEDCRETRPVKPLRIIK
jgi:hypothetical protein